MSVLSPRAVGRVHLRARIAAAIAATAAIFAPSSFATSLAGYAVIHQMPHEAGAEGQSPAGDLVVAPDGSVYGSSQFLGAASFRCYCTLGGTLWKLNPKGFPVVLHGFTGADGLTASTGIVQGQDRAWYGMTTPSAPRPPRARPPGAVRWCRPPTATSTGRPRRAARTAWAPCSASRRPAC